jgi:hypothetical protein
LARVKTVALIACLVVLSTAGHSDLIWWDGTRDAGNAPPGKLLSDNVGYYGDCVRTGVDYTYEAQPDVRPDVPKFERDRPGRALLDGNPRDGVARKGPLAVMLDFKRGCTFAEIDLCTMSPKLSVKLETAVKPGEWKMVHESQVVLRHPTRPGTMHHFSDYIDAHPGAMMQRIPLPEKPQGRYLRVSVESDGNTNLSEVVAWGDAEVTAENPEQFNPVLKTKEPLKWCQFSIPGIDKMGIVFNEFNDWKQRIGGANKLKAVWSQVSTWDGITEKPILPDRDKINKPVQLVMARNETECAAIALTNIQWPDKLETEVKLGEFHRVGDSKPVPEIKGKLRVAGAIPSSIFGVVLGPLLESDNMPSLGILKHYLTNADGIHDFPKLTLPEMTAAVMWLSVTTDGVQPGVYEAELSCSTPETQPLKIRAQVLDVTLPRSFAWVGTYSTYSRQFPFEYSDRVEREAEYHHSIGISAYDGFPAPGTVMAAAHKLGGTVHGVIPLPDRYLGPELSEANIREIDDITKATVARAKELGLKYDEWYIELWDEPDEKKMAAYEKVCKQIHKADPNVRIYANPMTNKIGDWYNKEVAVSIPNFKGSRMDLPEWKRVFSAPRWINAYYVVATNSAKGERTYCLERYRRFAWEAMIRGYNGWGWFAYYQPCGDPWNDLDSECPDFEVVYPGPRGPIASRASEVAREGYEDYCLIELLKQQGKKRDVDALMKAYKNDVPLTELHLRALKAAARR